MILSVLETRLLLKDAHTVGWMLQDLRTMFQRRWRQVEFLPVVAIHLFHFASKKSPQNMERRLWVWRNHTWPGSRAGPRGLVRLGQGYQCLSVLTYIDSKREVENHPQDNNWSKGACNLASSKGLDEKDENENCTWHTDDCGWRDIRVHNSNPRTSQLSRASMITVKLSSPLDCSKNRLCRC